MTCNPRWFFFAQTILKHQSWYSVRFRSFVLMLPHHVEQVSIFLGLQLGIKYWYWFFVWLYFWLICLRFLIWEVFFETIGLSGLSDVLWLAIQYEYIQFIRARLLQIRLHSNSKIFTRHDINLFLNFLNANAGFCWIFYHNLHAYVSSWYHSRFNELKNMSGSATLVSKERNNRYLILIWIFLLLFAFSCLPQMHFHILFINLIVYICKNVRIQMIKPIYSTRSWLIYLT